MIKLKRAYETAEDSDGFRVLVDRIWPRGVSKEKAHLDEWLKQVGPTTELRKWFGHDPAKFPEFKTRYQQEIAAGPEADAFKQLQAWVKEHDVVTLVYGAKDHEHNQAVILKEMLEK
ncbi:DUF488 domain-containing protein [Enterococcus sp. CSURQ0835]|uniref:DUF488 domain-containing protein n=1 Tax=Enterococcus sp. CSURQ0835 TaxID=2681394 RepID=UPI001358ACA6|nr:DUF488 family protein [Enterococcus sp. CSURQ0835]